MLSPVPEAIEGSTSMSVRVSLHAAVKRINRRLAPCDRMLHRSRSARARFDLGEFYVRDFSGNYVVETHVAVEDFAREVGALAAYEWIDFD